MITILSDDKKQNIGNKLYGMFQSRGVAAEYISISGLNIKPCYSCGGCSTKTYGKCVIQDDMDVILRKMIRTDKLIWVTPVTFGSYSSDTKKVFDRSAVLGDTHYYVKKGELIKGMRNNVKEVFAVGVKDHCSKEEKDAFEKLLQENINIMNVGGKAFVVEQHSEIASIVEEICR